MGRIQPAGWCRPPRRPSRVPSLAAPRVPRLAAPEAPGARGQQQQALWAAATLTCALALVLYVRRPPVLLPQAFECWQ